jgi:DNA-directed RNA polymerase
VHDIYLDLAKRVGQQSLVEDDRWADYWRKEFEWLGERGIRKLFKPPVMTFAYNVTEPGMVRQIYDEYFELLLKHNRPYPQLLNAKGKPDPGRYGYLAKKARAAAMKLLPKPAAVMRYLGALVANQTYQNLCLECVSPTGFVWGNRYHLPRLKTVNMFSGGERMQYRVAEGCRPIVDQEAIRKAAPNFVHSMDAAHLIRVVNAATAEDIETLTVHDCFACLAPDAERFNRIIRVELAMLYAGQDHLRTLRDRASAPILPMINPPEYGSHDPITVQAAIYAWT